MQSFTTIMQKDEAQKARLHDKQNIMIDFRDPDYLNFYRKQILKQEDITNDLEILYYICKRDFYIQFIQNLIYFAYHQINSSNRYYLKRLTTSILEILFSDKCNRDFYIWIDPKEQYTILNSLCTNGDFQNIKYLMSFLKHKYRYNPQMICDIILHVDRNGTSPVNSACSNKFLNIVTYLINFTTDVFGKHSNVIRNLHYSKDKFGNVLYGRACFDGDLETIDFLLSNFSDYCGKKNSEEFKTYFSECNIVGFTTINTACTQNNFKVVEYLLKQAEKIYGCVNTDQFRKYISQCEMKNNFTPLINACKLGNYEIAKLLIKAAKKAYANDPAGLKQFLEFTNRDGYSSLDSAYYGNHINCMWLLLENGVDLGTINMSKIVDLNHFIATCQALYNFSEISQERTCYQGMLFSRQLTYPQMDCGEPSVAHRPF